MTFVAHQRLKASDLTALQQSTAAALFADGALPGQIVGDISLVTSDSAAVPSAGTEIVVQSITVPVVAGRRYSIHFNGAFSSSSTASDTARVRIREDSLTGNQLDSGNVVVGVVGSVGAGLHIMAFYTAVATGSKTFVFTLERAGGAGDIHMEAASDRPGIALVRYDPPMP